MAKTRPASRRSAADTREHVLRVAHDLFYWRGIRAVGVDTVAAEAGIAPTTLYRLFPSKDDLVAAYMERTDRDYRAWFIDALRGADARAKILSLFDALIAQLQPDRCRGCPFLMTLSEIPDGGAAAHRVAVATKQWVREQFVELTTELSRSRPIPDPVALADHLTLLMEGAYASAQALTAYGPARRARSLAESLLPVPGRPKTGARR